MDLGNGVQGINVNSPDNLIGGTAPGEGNLISGNGDRGILINNPTASGNRVEGNLIGTDITGTAAIPNHLGIAIGAASSCVIGGTAPGSRNIISGNLNNGIQIDNDSTASNNRIEGNFIGTDVTGTIDLGNGSSGVFVIGAVNTVIGGVTPAARNVISGNRGGIVVAGSTASGNRIEGNFIGTDVTGTADLGNDFEGVYISGLNNTVGGSAVGARNVISGNDQIGIAIVDGADGNRIEGNYIGVDVSGTTDLGNSSEGILILSSTNNTIGGLAAGATNLIAFNNGAGIFLAGASANNSLSANRIFSNIGLGIDLNGDGITANDAGDVDTGPNNLQNFPVLDPIITAGTVNGSIDSTAGNTAYPVRIEFFANAACDMSGNGEGEVFLGAANIAAPGNFSFNYTPVPGQPIITATATDANGNTSEFSNCACPVLTLLPATLPNSTGGAYNQTISAIGGTAPYIFSVISGIIPPGLSFNTTTGQLSGTPTANGSFNFTIKATDASGCMGTQAYTVNVSGVCPTITVVPTGPLPFGFAGTPYIPLTLSAFGGTGPYTFSSIGGTLPPGIAPQQVGSTWGLGGTPTTQGLFNFTLQATDANGCTGTRSLSLLIYGPTPTLIVTTTVDENGENPAACSLREAITAANTNAAFGGCNAGQPSYDIIKFSLPTGASYTIMSGPVSFPFVTESLFIDGSTGDSLSPRVELNGTNATQGPNPGDFPHGLSFRANFCYARSLVINGFDNQGFGIELNTGDLNVVEDCYIGTDFTGSNQLGNNVGIGMINGSFGNRIGGAASNQLNLISGNLAYGIYMDGSVATTIRGNKIGTNLAGTSGLSNGTAGIAIFSSGNSTSNTITGNTIAYNYIGIVVSDASGLSNRNRITQNRIFANTAAGIDLIPSIPGLPGLTPNDTGDTDEGPNRLQNFPVLNPVTTDGTVTGSLDTLVTSANFPIFVEFYANSACDSSGNGEGEQYLGSLLLSNAAAASNFSFTYSPVSGKPFITSLAYDAAGNTSEFSNCVSANQPPTIVLAAPITQQEGGPASNHLLATVSDPNQAANTLNVTSSLASGSGVTISNINVNAAGQVTADLLALCLATTSTFSLTVTDAGGLMATANLIITVQPNTSPTISSATITAQKGSVNTMHLVATVSDLNQTSQSLTIQINGGSSAMNDNVTVSNLSIDAAGNVSAEVSATCDAATETPRTFTLTVTDNCGLSTSSTLTVNVIPNAKPVLSYTNQTVAVGGALMVIPATGPSDNGTFIIELDKVKPKAGISVAVDPVTGVVSITDITDADTYTIDVTIRDNCNQKTKAKFDVTVTALALAETNMKTRPVRNDFDGDGKSDLFSWNPEDGNWRIRRSSDGQIRIKAWGRPGDVIAPADYDGDLRSDLAVWRAADGLWLIERSSDGKTMEISLGEQGDAPVPGDYDGDGKADAALWRAISGEWLIKRSADSEEQHLYFGRGDEVAVPGDYDGDGKHDPALWQQASGRWLIRLSDNGSELDLLWGASGNLPVPADYDGDGKTDIAVWHGRVGAWIVRRSSDWEPHLVRFGAHAFGDEPTPGDYDGDGKADVAVLRAIEGAWYISTAQQTRRINW
ncbi:MAG: VCBS repeat-containing protein [Acidobacteriota bacterium]|nr:MAG: VCBS repeat-containing protein [Acidobacteriota bacterium]